MMHLLRPLAMMHLLRPLAMVYALRSKHVLMSLIVGGCLVLVPSVAPAQQNIDPDTLQPYRDVVVGLYGSYNFNQHSAGIQGLPTIPSCCPSYGDGTGNGFIIGLMLDMYIVDDLTFQGRVGIHSGGGLLLATENETVNTDGVEQVGVFEHRITSQHLWLTLEPLAAYSPVEHLQVLLGPSAGLLLNASFSQRETILQPSDAVFENDSTSRAIYDGEIPEPNSLALGITLGLRYEIPFANNDWSVVPEVFYTLALSNLQQAQSWRMNALRLGLAVQYSFWIQPLP